MANFNLPEAWTLKGNEMTNNQNAVLSVFEAQLRAELTSDKSTVFLRLDATDQQIAEMAGVAIALYRVTVRVLWGSTWDELTGTKRQLGQVYTTQLVIDQPLTIDFNIPEFDIERFLKSPNNIGIGMVVNWTASFTRNLYENLELIFLQGAKDYAIAKSLVLPMDLINLTPETAVNAYYTVWARNNRLIKMVNKITVGVNRSDLLGATGIDSNMGLSKAFVKLNYSQIASDTVVTGRRYTSNIAGMEFWESFYLEQDFDVDTETAMHLEKTYKLLNVHGIVIHKRMFGMPLSFTKIRSKLSDDADNVRIIGKCLYSLPAAIRPDLMYVIMPTMPTIAEMEAARAKDKTTNPTGTDLTYQSTLYDSFKTVALRNIIFFDNLPEVEAAGDVPTSAELDKALVKYGNLGFDINHAEITAITANSATIQPKDKDTAYYGKVNITFVTKKTGSTPPKEDDKESKQAFNTEIKKAVDAEMKKFESKNTKVINAVLEENKALKAKLEALESSNKDEVIVEEEKKESK